MTQEITVSDAVIINELRVEVCRLNFEIKRQIESDAKLAGIKRRLDSEEHLYRRNLTSTKPLSLDTLSKLYDNSQYYDWLRDGGDLDWQEFYAEFGNDATQETWQALRVLKSI